MQVIGSLKNISMASSKLLLAAKSLSVDPAAANAKNLLAAAARYHIIKDGKHFPGLRIDFYGGVFFLLSLFQGGD